MFRLAYVAFALAACDYASTAIPRDNLASDTGGSDTAGSDAAEAMAGDTASRDDAPDTGPEPDCAALALADFRDHVWVPVFEAHGCIVCHRPHGLAGRADVPRPRGTRSSRSVEPSYGRRARVGLTRFDAGGSIGSQLGGGTDEADQRGVCRRDFCRDGCV